MTVVVGWHTMMVYNKVLESKQNCVEMDRSGRTVEQYTKSCDKRFLHPFGIFPGKKKLAQWIKCADSCHYSYQTTIHAILFEKWHAATVRSTVFWISGAVILCQMYGKVGEPMKTEACLAMGCRREPGRSELHLSEGNGSVFAFPVYPDYSLCQSRNRNIWSVCCIIADKIVCVQVERWIVPDYYCRCHKDHWGWSCSSSCTTSLPCRPWHSGSPEHRGPCPGLRMDAHYGTS